MQSRVRFGRCSREYLAAADRKSPSRNVFVLGVNATILLCPPLSPATIKRTPPARVEALRRQRKYEETLTPSGGLMHHFPAVVIRELLV